MTFTLNQVLLRSVSPTGLGFANMVEFVIGSVLFISREPVRLALQPLDPSAKNFYQTVINFSYLGLAVCGALVVPVFYWQLDLSGLQLHPWEYQLGIGAVLASVILELLSEPFYNLNQAQLNMAKRAKIESMASFVKCAVQFFVVTRLAIGSSTDVTFVFGYVISQFCYSLTIFGCYSKFRLIWPTKTSEGIYLTTSTFNYLRSLFVQLVFKHFLTEGDKFVLNQLFPIFDQGYYSVVSNYGSLLARILFQPIEESLRMNVSKQFALKLNTKSTMATLNNTIFKVATLYIYLLTLILIFAPVNSSYLVNLAFASFPDKHKLSQVFQIYWYYLPFLAVNGVTEALFNSIYTDSKHVSQYSRLMLVNSICFYATSTYFIQYRDLGLVGLVVANSINMGVRIIFCFVKLRSIIDFKSQQWQKFVYFWTASIAVVAIQMSVIGHETTTSLEFAKSFLLGLVLLVVIAVLERKNILS
ncbi:hypothetical protein OGAPHI_001644 [Ogataea philodendri]|uniref:Man(5)GlcNAc(2)-PP-dolichol translocation protein RFT1 n=1 Tax=Ogataea philodendri TaxID=1378263 RepID=A0A9P8T7D4_9ASCO|nr:uncharacterized protein OGAPHI_001644 [Ogataea philodendri]KAH3669048.1 hypothetical protein OGAPHI_001644 [Ogataea philodendri]